MNPAILKLIGASIAPRHKSVARMMGYCLTANDPSTWWKMVDVLVCRLSPTERGTLAMMALAALDRTERRSVIAAANHAATIDHTDDGRAAA